MVVRPDPAAVTVVPHSRARTTSTADLVAELAAQSTGSGPTAAAHQLPGKPDVTPQTAAWLKDRPLPAVPPEVAAAVANRSYHDVAPRPPGIAPNEGFAVEVTNVSTLRNGTYVTVRADANPDGSFSVDLDRKPGDKLSIRSVGTEGRSVLKRPPPLPNARVQGSEIVGTAAPGLSVTVVVSRLDDAGTRVRSDVKAVAGEDGTFRAPVAAGSSVDWIVAGSLPKSTTEP